MAKKKTGKKQKELKELERQISERKQALESLHSRVDSKLRDAARKELLVRHSLKRIFNEKE